jgi:release factor glutamine methyltransferase
MASAKTIRELIAVTRPWLEKRGVPDARLETELIVAHALGVRRLDLFLDLDRPLDASELETCRVLVARRGKREPLAYLTGTRDIWGLSLKVTPDVLIPRQDTETLIELALARSRAEDEGMFIDACTGSGCVALAILKERPRLRALATDASAAALAVARENAALLGLGDRFDAREGDLLAPCTGTRARFIVGNPPYVRPDEMGALMPEVRDFEPAVALVGEGVDGLGHHRRILADAAALLEPGGFVALEIGAEQGAALGALTAHGLAFERVVKDLAQNDRVGIWTRS